MVTMANYLVAQLASNHSKALLILSHPISSPLSAFFRTPSTAAHRAGGTGLRSGRGLGRAVWLGWVTGKRRGGQLENVPAPRGRATRTLGR